MPTLLVTGAAGFIGSNFVHYWHKNHSSDPIIALDALTYSGSRESLADLQEEITFVVGDIRDQTLVEKLMSHHRVDIVVNFAAESHNSVAIVNPTTFFATNVLGTQSLLEAARRVGVERFHQISTCEVYGDLSLEDPSAFTEKSPYRPRTPYNASKAAADHAVRAYGYTYNLPFTITNSANNYGPYQFPEKVIPLFITHALRGQQLPLYQSVKHRREWLHVDDYCRAVEAVLLDGKEGETYHVGTGVEVDIETLAKVILSELELPDSLISIVPDRPSHDCRYLLDSSKIRRELGWQPLISFEEGLEKTISWYRENGQWWRPLLERRPIDETKWQTPLSSSSAR